MTTRFAVLASGSGSNLQAMIDACERKVLDAAVVAVVSDRCDAFALERAKRHGVGSVVCVPRDRGIDRATWDARLADVVAASAPDWIILAGFMRILSSAFLDRFPGRVVNLHPALPGELPGTMAIERAYSEHTAGRRRHTGVTVHLVPDDGVDSGPVLASTVVDIRATDDLASLTVRMHAAEHELLISTLARLTQEVPT